MTPNLEEILRERLSREQAVISAMQLRTSRWLTPIGYFFWRKPWRSSVSPFKRESENYHLGFRRWLNDFFQWLRYAHDCSDPAIGCSCQGGYRFPNPETDGGAKAAQP